MKTKNVMYPKSNLNDISGVHMSSKTGDFVKSRDLVYQGLDSLPVCVEKHCVTLCLVCDTCYFDDYAIQTILVVL